MEIPTVKQPPALPQASGPPLAPRLPRHIQVEVTGACNLKCRMCLVRYRPALAPRTSSMNYETFYRLLEELPEVKVVTLQGLGEPLMAPDIFRMIEYCKGRGITCGFNTNATLLTRNSAERLIDLGLDWLHVSLDGASKATYEFVRDHANWDVVERNVAGLMSAMRARGAERPQLSLVMVLMRFNYADLPAVVQRAADWGIPRVRAQNLSHDFSDAPREAYRAIQDFVHEQSVTELAWAEVEPVVLEAQKVAARAGISLRLPSMAPAVPQAKVDEATVPCAWPWRSSYVNWNGTVQPCCMVMGSDRSTLGSVNETSFADVWSSEEYQSFRRELLSSNPPAVCRGCSEYRGTF
jgi:radical SAM protein with 4Fe4S-binding SPASM domain